MSNLSTSQGNEDSARKRSEQQKLSPMQGVEPHELAGLMDKDQQEKFIAKLIEKWESRNKG